MPRRPLLSHSSVLILSAFLIGVVVHHVVPAEFELYVFCGGGVGLLAYLGLDIAASRRRDRAEELAQERLERDFSSKMNRHLPRKSKIRSPRPRFNSIVAWEQYVSVTRQHR